MNTYRTTSAAQLHTRDRIRLHTGTPVTVTHVEVLDDDTNTLIRFVADAGFAGSLITPDWDTFEYLGEED
jgi:hypothetical protein